MSSSQITDNDRHTDTLRVKIGDKQRERDELQKELTCLYNDISIEKDNNKLNRKSFLNEDMNNVKKFACEIPIFTRFKNLNK